MENKNFLDRFEWLKNKDFVFTWDRDQCKHSTVYNSSMYAYYNVGEVLDIYKTSFNDVFIQYGDIY